MQAQKLNIRIIIKIIGIILIIEGLFMLSCLPVSWYFKSTDFRALLISGIITLVPGIIIILFTQNINQKEASKKDGYLIVVLTWLTMSIFGTLPFLLSGSIINFTDAFFETISGFSTTGASILTNIEVIPKGVLFWRSLTQWIGGMGIIVFTVALLPLFGFGGMNLLQAEAPGITKDKIHPRVAATARRLWSIYFTFTILEIILLMLGDMNWYEAVCHAFTTMSTGGFSPKNSCIADYSPYIQYIIIIFMICGSTSFPLVYFFIKRQFIKVFKNEEFLFYISVIILSSLFIAIGLYTYSNLDIEKSIRNALFQVTSIISTTGFVNTDYMQWPSFLWFFLFLLMFLGGMTGSTSGGLKMMRHLLLFKNVRNQFAKLIHPNAVVNIKFCDKTVNRDVITNILSLFMIYMVAFAIGVLILVTFNLPLPDSCGSVITCMDGIGPGLGSTGAVGNYAHLHPVSKWTLSTLMLLGRLEFLSVIIIFSPHFWKK